MKFIPVSFAIRCATLLIILFVSNISSSSAQQTFFWSRPEKIPEYYQYSQEPPYLIADQNHTVHAFNSQPLRLEDNSSPKAIFYRQWTMEGGWTYPNDIIYDGGSGNVDVLDVTYDQSGVVYLIYQKDFQDVYFTHAYLADAGESTAWSPPILIAGESTHVSVGFEGVGAIATDGMGNIVVVYSGSESGKGLYSTYSSDYGNNWARLYPVYLTGDESMIMTDPELFFGESGIIHGVWATFRSDGFGGPGYYANFNPENGSWSEPMALDLPGIRTPSVIEFKGDVFVSYYHASTNGNWWRQSSDGGDTWTAPSQLSPRHVGTNGRVSFVVDSANTLHGFFGERINDLNHGMWHIVWTGLSWTVPEAIVKGPQMRDIQGGDGFDPRSARAVVSNGKVILVTWGTDGFAGENGAWYSYKRLNTPELPVVPLTVPTVAVRGISTESDPILIPTTTSVGTPTTTVLGNTGDLIQGSRSPQSAILLGVIPVVLLLIGIIGARYISSTRNK